VKRLVIALLFVAMGGVAVFAAFYVSSELRRGKDWPTVPGAILERRVGERMGTRSPSFLPQVTYAYSVDGHAYQNDQVYVIRRTGGLEDQIQTLVDGLPDPVPVHYNPDQPSESYLLMNSMTTFWVTLGAGALGLLIGLLQLLVIWTKTGSS
jgi:hypothetical protein